MKKLTGWLRKKVLEYLTLGETALNPDIDIERASANPCQWGHNFQVEAVGSGLQPARILFCKRCGKLISTEVDSPIPAEVETELVATHYHPDIEPSFTFAAGFLRKYDWAQEVTFMVDEDGDNVFVITRDPDKHVPTEGLIREVLNDKLPKDAEYQIHVQWPKEGGR